MKRSLVMFVDRARSAVMFLVASVLALAMGATPSLPQPPAQDPKGPIPRDFKNSPGPTLSGIYDFREFNFGINVTECPQARLRRIFPDPLDRREIDDVERISDGGNDVRTNEEFSCTPQN